MSKLLFTLQDETAHLLRRGDIDGCIDVFASRLSSLAPSPFHVALELDFTNDPLAVASHFDQFIVSQSALFPVRAIYTETNGFDINTDCWYCDLFAYTTYGGHEDFDWLSDWQSEDSAPLILTGMERLQAVYASDAFGDRAHDDACDAASMIVVSSFQRLIQRASRNMQRLDFPLLSTSHDYDFIAEVAPSPK
jgi:hypothetical protein